MTSSPVSTVPATVGESLDTFTPNECANLSDLGGIEVDPADDQLRKGHF